MNVVLAFCAQTIIKETFVSNVPETREHEREREREGEREREFTGIEKLCYRTNSLSLECTTNMDFVFYVSLVS